MKKYSPQEIEGKWQKTWEKQRIYRFKSNSKQRKYYNLVELPYPSGDLHLGHWFAFVPPDTHARFKKMQGFNVFFPNGFDAFGLPAENAAIKRGIHPQDWTMENIKTMIEQFKTMGTMIDWDHKVITCLPEYYKWNQWIFLRMLENGLAVRKKALSNWCPKDQTVLANEHIENGKCWRCGTLVVQKEIEQWFLKITDYADQLIWKDQKEDWPKAVKDGQNNWIGKSEGIEISFPIKGSKEKILAYTVFPETIFGVTYMVLAPEHPLVLSLTKQPNKSEVEKYVKIAKGKTELERKTLERHKTGVFTGSYCINPATNKSVPVWVSDYVISTYGTGAVMGVPGSDHRDFEFAKKYRLPIIKVIGRTEKDTNSEEVLEEGYLVNSGKFSGLKTPNPAKEKIKDWMEKERFGKRKVQYHLRDWSISRQRYWGTPVPVIHCKKCGEVPVPDKDLPVILPYEVDYTPKGKPPLASATKWLKVKCPKCGGWAVRDAETLDTFFDSSWYFWRYITPKFNNGPFDKKEVNELMPVDVYFGGSEHTLGHTLYARFFTKFFKDIKLTNLEEFALKRIQHGVILGPDGNRMSKSHGNVVNPDDIVREYGADTVRLYLSFMMPYESTAPFSQGAIFGIFRFLKRVWDLYDKVSKSSLSTEDLKEMHKAIKKVTDDLENFRFNTAVAAIMTWLNHLSKKGKVSLGEYETLLKLIAPFAPHFAEELWQMMGNKQSLRGLRNSVHLESWPKFDPKFLVEENVTIVVQVNGKLREILRLRSGQAQDKKIVEKQAKESSKIQKYLDKPVRKVIYVEGKIINFVV